MNSEVKIVPLKKRPKTKGTTDTGVYYLTVSEWHLPEDVHHSPGGSFDKLEDAFEDCMVRIKASIDYFNRRTGSNLKKPGMLVQDGKILGYVLKDEGSQSPYYLCVKVIEVERETM